jgi:hypothetical protein
MLRFCRIRVMRSSADPGRPNRRSNTTRGFVSSGIGEVGDFHEIVFM